MELTQAEFDVLLRQDLTTFIARTFAHLDPQTRYAHNWHIDLLADRLTQVYQGKLRRLIITVPPRSLKSICASVAFPAWVLGRDPSKRIICASYGQELSNKLAATPRPSWARIGTSGPSQPAWPASARPRPTLKPLNAAAAWPPRWAAC